MSLLAAVRYLPILTTLLSAAFFVVLLRAYRERRSGPHLAWWAAGIFAYGLGTAIESAITLSGNSVELNKAWYIAGALLGGYPLAQGVAYLLTKRRTANILSAITIPFLMTASICVLLSPVDLSQLQANRPTGAILAWHWVRLMTPFLNLYAFAFLVGGAVVSAIRYSRLPAMRYRFVANCYIAVGGLLPGIGGSMAKAGFVEVLYVAELIGLVLIWRGYAIIANRRTYDRAVAQPEIDSKVATTAGR